MANAQPARSGEERKRMRILHTADWHVGARLGAHERLPDQIKAIRSVVETARKYEPDLIIHAGDVFDAFNPGHDALRVAVTGLAELAKCGPTIVVGGNHDSYPLLDALGDMSALWGELCLRFVTVPAAMRIETAAGGAVIVAMPFISAAKALKGSKAMPEDRGRAYADQIAGHNIELWTRAGEITTPGDLAVYAAHLHVAGAKPGRSERRVTVSDEYATHGQSIPKAAYAAFGHIHDQQEVPGSPGTAHYAGSIVALDFGEATLDKHTLIVDTDGETVELERVGIDSGRPLFDFEGGVDELEAAAAGGALDDHLVRAIVQSDERVYDLSARLLSGSPKVKIHELINQVRNEAAIAITDHDYQPVTEPPIEELYTEWRKTRTGTEREKDETAQALFIEAIQNAQAPGTSDFGIGALQMEADKLLDDLGHARRDTG